MSSLDLPHDLTDGLGVEAAVPISGGDTAAAFRLETAGGPLFAKTMADPPAGMMAVEVAGLHALREHAPEFLGVPEVVRWSDRGIVLEWIEEAHGSRRPGTEEEFGRGLAALHRAQGEAFGGLDPVAEDAAPAVSAGRGHGVGRALEAVERAGPLALGDGEGLVVVVAAGVAGGHDRLLVGRAR